MRTLAVAAVFLVAAQPSSVERRQPLPAGNQVVVQDGDVVVIENDARVRLVRRTDAHIRVIFNASERWLIVLADHATAGAPDGRVDSTHSYTDIGGEWPFEARWEGMATLEEYGGFGPGMSARGVGLRMPQGLVQILSAPATHAFRMAEAVAVLSSRGSSGGTYPGVDFDRAERDLREQVRRSAQRESSQETAAASGSPIVGMPRGVGSIAVELDGVPVTSGASIVTTPGGAVRVGGSIAPPTKVHDVSAITPELASRTGVRGVVILEITIGVTGDVTHARVLRSIPMLDEAALAAVRQWRYTPTLVNGRATPVVMTVSVSFSGE